MMFYVRATIEGQRAVIKTLKSYDKAKALALQYDDGDVTDADQKFVVIVRDRHVLFEKPRGK